MKLGHYVKGDPNLSLRQRLLRMLKSKRNIIICTIFAVNMMVSENLINYKARNLLENENMTETSGDEIRDLITVDLGGGDCDIGNPTEDAYQAPENATRTLLTSYPGSGKRFTWTVIKALTNSEGESYSSSARSVYSVIFSSRYDSSATIKHEFLSSC